MSLKTREKLIESAKLLFIRKGVENTTISDIASASDKGRRTIYTYFKNKREIYKAVVERESDKMVSAMKSVVDTNEPAAVKLSNFINLRIDQAKIATSPWSTIKSLVNMDFGRAEKTRRMAAEKEQAMLASIFDEGVRTGQFHPERAKELQAFLYPLLRMLDYMPSGDEATKLDVDFAPALSRFITHAISSSTAGSAAQ